MRHIRLSIILGAALTLTTACHNHEADNHGEGKHNDSHGAEIILSEKQATAAGVMTETVAEGEMMTAIRVSGVLMAGQGDEQTVAATAAGIVRLAGAAMAEKGILPVADVLRIVSVGR